MGNASFAVSRGILHTSWAVGAIRFWLGLALTAAMLSLSVNAHAQTVLSFNTNIPYSGNYGYGPTYSITLGNLSPGTELDVTWTFTNTTGKPVILLPSGTNPNKVNFNSGNIVLMSESVPGKALTAPIDPADLGPVTLQQGQALTITFKASVTAAVTGAIARISYSVGGVFDQVWNYGDIYSFCSNPAPVIVAASAPQYDWVVTGATPDCRYRQAATFVNDLPYPVTVYYTGYSDSGWIAPYITGTLCRLSTCGNTWVDGITLQPGEASALFTMLVGMPWYIGNESKLTTGFAQFDWGLFTAVDDFATTEAGAPVDIDVLANDTLPGSGPYTVTSVVPADPAAGTWVINTNNTVTFTPAPGFTGDATAQYTVEGSTGQTATATITVTVKAKAKDQPVTTPIPTLGGLALVLLALGLTGLAGQRLRRRY